MLPLIALQLTIAGLIFSALIIAVELGFRRGAARRAQGEKDDHLSTIQGALLGLLALLLGFSFAGASSRFIERQDILVREANAVASAYARADALPEAPRAEVRAVLRAYTEDRMALFRDVSKRSEPEIISRLDRHHEAAWRIAVAESRQDRALLALLLPALDQISDLLNLREAASRRHLPFAVLALLLGSAAVSMFAVGHGQGLSGHRSRTSVVALAVLVAACLWITVDLDHPRLGLIRISPAPLESLLESMNADQPATPAPIS